MSQNGNEVTVAAKNVSVVVDVNTGRIVFKDKNGNVILKEVAQGGKTFKPFQVPEKEIGVGTLTDSQRNGWTWRALFDSPEDEAFYGLGQHQAEELT